jgi:hypothetical protein
MRRSVTRLIVLAAIVVAGCLAAGCGSSVSSAVSNLTSRAATVTPTATSTDTPTATSTATPATPTPTATATPSVTVTQSVTQSVTVTPTAPSSTASATTPTASGSAAPGGSGTSLLWLWILLGAVVLIGLILWIVSASRRRSATAADSRSRLIDAYAKGSALHDAMSVAEAPGWMTAADAGARWADIQRRADDLTQTLYVLRDTVPDPDDRARIADTLVSLQAVRSAMAAERAPGGASPQQADVVRSRLYAFESSLRALRAGNEGPP